MARVVDRQGDKLPLGDPMLAWSFNRDGEAQSGLVERRDQTLNVNTQEKRKERQDLTSLARPQMGVDALKDKFSRPTQSVPGVADQHASGAARPGVKPR